MTLKQKFLFVAIILFAIFFRFYQIAQMPGGLFPDEAANGLDINLMQQGQLQPFYERGNGREALFFYMLWGSVEVFGKGPWQHHSVSALVGVLAVIFCFLFTRRLFLTKKTVQPKVGTQQLSSLFSENILPSAIKFHARVYEITDPLSYIRATNIALLASFLMAVSSWHVVLSRTAFRANLIPLFTTLTLYLGLAAFQAVSRKKQLFLWFLTGAVFALGFYSYIAYRVMVPIVIMIVVWPALASFKEQPFWENVKKLIKKYFAPKVWLAIGFTIFIYPLAKYFYTHPGAFVGRSGQVSVFNPELNQGNLLGAIWQVLKESLAAYITVGDLNWRHNISGFPFLSQLISPFFVVGLILVTLLAAVYFFTPHKRASWWKYFLLAGWFWGMLLPVIATAEGIPHGLRAIGTIPAVFIISAWALYEFAEIILKLHQKLWQHALFRNQDPQWVKENHFVPLRMRLVNASFKVLAACFAVALIFQTYFLYFVYAANSPENFYYFRSDLTPVSKYLKDRCKKEQTYLILDTFSVQTTDYLTSDWHGNFANECNVPYRQIDPENSWQLSGLKSGDEIVFTQSSVFDTKKFKQYHPEAQLTLEYRNKFNQTVMAVYRIGIRNNGL